MSLNQEPPEEHVNIEELEEVLTTKEKELEELEDNKRHHGAPTHDKIEHMIQHDIKEEP